MHDYVGGLADIETRRVRFIGEPSQRIAEDYLRILRFFRIHAAYGEGRAGSLPAYEACIAGRDGLCTLSAERIRIGSAEVGRGTGSGACAGGDGQWRAAAAAHRRAWSITVSSPR